MTDTLNDKSKNSDNLNTSAEHVQGLNTTSTLNDCRAAFEKWGKQRYGWVNAPQNGNGWEAWRAAWNHDRGEIPVITDEHAAEIGARWSSATWEEKLAWHNNIGSRRGRLAAHYDELLVIANHFANASQEREQGEIPVNEEQALERIKRILITYPTAGADYQAGQIYRNLKPYLKREQGEIPVITDEHAAEIGARWSSATWEEKLAWHNNIGSRRGRLAAHYDDLLVVANHFANSRQKREMVDRPIDLVAISTNSIYRFALKTIAEFPITDMLKNMDAINMQKMAIEALNHTKIEVREETK